MSTETVRILLGFACWECMECEGKTALNWFVPLPSVQDKSDLSKHHNILGAAGCRKLLKISKTRPCLLSRVSRSHLFVFQEWFWPAQWCSVPHEKQQAVRFPLVVAAGRGKGPHAAAGGGRHHHGHRADDPAGWLAWLRPITTGTT